MKRLLAVSLIVLGMASAARAQDQVLASPEAITNVAADFAKTSAASSAILRSGNWAPVSLTSPEASLAGPSFSTPVAAPRSFPTFNLAPSTTLAQPVALASPATLAEPSPAPPNPSYNYKERDYSWEIGLGFALVRFRSSVYSATAPGLNSSVAYFLNDWMAIEGAVTTGFAPTVFQNEHVKYLGYGAGPKFSLGRGRLEPWVHALVGGVHIIPQTALGGKNGFELQAGGGADYALNPRVSARIEADYLRSNLFGQSQNSFQGVIGIVFHF
jgi:hypothetical protein